VDSEHILINPTKEDINIPLILCPRHVAEALSPKATTIPVRTALFPLPFFPLPQNHNQQIQYSSNLIQMFNNYQ
jgi:hypothetical protein